MSLQLSPIRLPARQGEKLPRMAKHYPLWHAGRAGGIQDHRGLFRRRRHDLERTRVEQLPIGASAIASEVDHRNCLWTQAQPALVREDQPGV
jgi:hypothetical protein